MIGDIKFVILLSFGFCLLHLAEFRHVPLKNQRGRARSRPRLLVIRPPAGSGQPNRVVVLADPRLVSPDQKNAKRTDTSRNSSRGQSASAAAAARHVASSPSSGPSSASSGPSSKSMTSSSSLPTSSASRESGSAASSPSSSGNSQHSHHHHGGMETSQRKSASARHPQSNAREQQMTGGRTREQQLTGGRTREQQMTGGRTRSLRNLIDTLRNNPRRASNELPGSNIARIADFIPRAAPPMLPSKNRFGELNIPIVIKSALRRMRKHHRRLGNVGGDPRRIDSSHVEHRIKQSIGIGRTDRPSSGPDTSTSNAMHSSAFPQSQRDFQSRNGRPHGNSRRRSSQQPSSSHRDNPNPPHLGRHSLGRNGVSRNRMSEGTSGSGQGSFRPSSTRSEGTSGSTQGSFRPSSTRGGRHGSGRGSNAGSRNGRWRNMAPGNRQRGNTGSNKRRIEKRPAVSHTPVVTNSNAQPITKPVVDNSKINVSVAAASANASNVSENTIAKKDRVIKANITITTKTLTPASTSGLHAPASTSGLQLNAAAMKPISNNSAATRQQITKIPSAIHVAAPNPPSPTANQAPIPNGLTAIPTPTDVVLAGNPTDIKHANIQPIPSKIDITSTNATNNMTSTKKIKTKTINVTTVVKGGTAADVAAAAASQAKLAEAVAQGKEINGTILAGLTGSGIQKPKPTLPIGSITVKRQPNGISLITLSDGQGEPVVLRASGPVKIERIVKPNGRIQFIINPIKKKKSMFMNPDGEIEMEEMMSSTVATTTLSEVEVPPITTQPAAPTTINTVKVVTTGNAITIATDIVTTQPSVIEKSTQPPPVVATVLADVINKRLTNTKSNKTGSAGIKAATAIPITAKAVPKSAPAVATTTSGVIGIKTTVFSDFTRPLVTTTVAPGTPNVPTVVQTTPRSSGRRRPRQDVIHLPRIPRPPRVAVRIPRPPPLPDRMFGNLGVRNHFRSRHNNEPRRHVPAPSQLGPNNKRSGLRRIVAEKGSSKGARREPHPRPGPDVMPHYEVITDNTNGSGKAV